jgi:GTPase
MRSLHGNTHGLKPNQLRRIEKLYQRRIPPRQVLTTEFARQLAALSSETGRQIGTLIDRKGYVEHVVVGDARQIQMPDFKRVRVATDRFRGLRFVHTHLRGEDLTRDDLTDLALLRLDLIAAIDVNPQTGLPGAVHAAHLLPLAADNANGAAEQFAFLKASLPSQLDLDFIALIDALEEEMARNRRASRRAGASERAILVNVSDSGRSEAEDSLAELRELAESDGLGVIDEVMQRRPRADPHTVVGKGKLDELLIRAMQLGADAIVFDRELQPSQVRAIAEATDLKVIDRSQLILDIFAQRAQSHEGKIQV